MKRKADTMKKHFLHDNSGVALVSVMVVATVCLLVATIVLELTYTSLMSRRVNKMANTNFYSAESAVDNLETILQSVAVYASKAMESDSSKQFVDAAADTLVNSAGATDLSDTAAISEYLFDSLDDEYKKILGTEAGVDADGKPYYVYDDTKFVVSAVTKREASDSSTKGSLTLSVKLSYENEKGFLTNISTDLVMNDVTRRKPASAYAMGSYSMFTGGGVEFRGNDTSNSQLPVFVQQGNVYVGTMQNSSTAMNITDSAVYLTGAAIINGDVYIKGKSVLNFTAGMDDSGSRTEVTVRGTVYIDKTAALVIDEDIDFCCKDIVIVDGSTQKSVWDGDYAYAAYDGSSSFKSHFPYDVTSVEGITNGVTSSVDKKLNATFDNGTTGGCVLIASGNEAYVAKYNGTAWKILKDGAEATTSALINHSDQCVARAKATIWTYDNKQVVVDAEMAEFVNVQLLYFQRNSASNTALHAWYAQIIKHDATTQITRGDLPITLGGASMSKLSSISTADSTTALLSGNLMTPNPSSDIFGITFASMGLGNITLDTNTLTGVMFKIGNIQDCAKNIPDDNSRILLACTYDDYTVQQNGGTLVGILISADKCKYDVNGRMVTTACSILNAKDDATGTAKTQIDNLFSELQYVTFMREPNNTTQYYAGGVNYREYYQLTMLDSLFTGGMKSFTSDGGSSSGGDVTMDITNMYDFISVENWESN